MAFFGVGDPGEEMESYKSVIMGSVMKQRVNWYRLAENFSYSLASMFRKHYIYVPQNRISLLFRSLGFIIVIMI